MQEIIDLFELHKGEFVLGDFHVVTRLIAVCTDDEDYYWVYWNGRKLTLSTCVGGFIVLKDKIDQKDYDNLIRLAKLNDLTQLKYMNTEKVKEHLQDEICKTDKLITEIYWDLK